MAGGWRWGRASTVSHPVQLDKDILMVRIGAHGRQVDPLWTGRGAAWVVGQATCLADVRYAVSIGVCGRGAAPDACGECRGVVGGKRGSEDVLYPGAPALDGQRVRRGDEETGRGRQCHLGAAPAP